MTFYLSPVELQPRVTGEQQKHRDGAHRRCRGDQAQGGQQRDERLRNQGRLARAARRGERNSGACHASALVLPWLHRPDNFI